MALKGTTPWNKGRRNVYSLETRKRMSVARKGKAVWAKGSKFSEEHRKNISRAHADVSGKRNPNWKGGRTAKIRGIWFSGEYQKWRRLVFERDNYTCVECGDKDVELNADHIKPKALYPELIFTLSNGRTLCVPCHKETDTYGARFDIKQAA